MLLTPSSINYNTTIVFLNNKALNSFVTANDEEGWVEVPDIAKMAPIDFDDTSALDNKDDVSEWEKVPTIKKQGKVEFKTLK